jgi:sulfur-carrier protein
MAVVRVLYFAWLRERIGMDAEDVDVLAGETAGDLAARLRARGGGHGEAFADLSRIRCAVDQAMAALDAPIGDAREIAFFPPVTGG